MYQMSHVLETMVVRAAIEARYREKVPVDPAELEQALKGALGEMQRTRPRIVEFAPRVALQRVLDLPSIRARLTAPAREPASSSLRRLYLALAR